MRQALRSLLADHSDIEVVGDAVDGRDALRQVPELDPGIVLMDVVMAGMGGIEATRLLLASFPAVHVIAVSLHDDRHFVAAMRAAGAAGYVHKDCVHGELVAALRAVADGGSWWGEYQGAR